MEQVYSPALCRRTYARYRLDDSATLIIDKKIEIPSILRDLSSLGAGLISDCPLKPEDKVEIIIRSSIFNSPVYKKARVAWCSKIDKNLYRTGLDFGLDNRIEFK